MEADTCSNEQALCTDTSVTSTSSGVLAWCEVQKGGAPHSSSCQAARLGSGFDKAQGAEPTIPATPSTPRQVAYRARCGTEGHSEDSAKLLSPFLCSTGPVSDADCRHDICSSLGRNSSASADEAPLSPVSADQAHNPIDTARAGSCSESHDDDYLMAPSVVMQRILTGDLEPEPAQPAQPAPAKQAPMGLVLRPPGRLLAMLKDGGLKHQLVSSHRSAPCTPFKHDTEDQLAADGNPTRTSVRHPSLELDYRKHVEKQQQRGVFDGSNWQVPWRAADGSSNKTVAGEVGSNCSLGQVHTSADTSAQQQTSAAQDSPSKQHEQVCLDKSLGGNLAMVHGLEQPFPEQQIALPLQRVAPATCMGDMIQASAASQQHYHSMQQADVQDQQQTEQGQQQILVGCGPEGHVDAGSLPPPQQQQQQHHGLTVQLPEDMEEQLRSMQEQQQLGDEQQAQHLDTEQLTAAAQHRKLQAQKSVSRLVAMWETQRASGEGESPAQPIPSPRPRLSHSSSVSYRGGNGPIGLDMGPASPSPPRRHGSLSENGGVLYSSSSWQRLRRTWQPPRSYVSWGGAAPSPGELPAEPSPKELVGEAATAGRQVFSSLQRADTAPAAMASAAVRAVRHDDLKSHRMLIPEELEDAVQSHVVSGYDEGSSSVTPSQVGQNPRVHSYKLPAEDDTVRPYRLSEGSLHSEASMAVQSHQVTTQSVGGVDERPIASHNVAFSVSDSDKGSEVGDVQAGEWEQGREDQQPGENEQDGQWEELGEGEQAGEWEEGDVAGVDSEGEASDTVHQPRERHPLHLDLPGWLVTGVIALAPLWRR